MLFDEILRRAEAFAATGARRMLGITGAPGAGKSTLAQALVRRLARQACYVPMDGFHLANDELLRLGYRDRKGAPETFDVAGYVALLRRLRDAGDEVVYAPRFNRKIEESIAGAIPITHDVPLIVTEGNYLLLDSLPWCHLRGLLDEVWYLDPSENLRYRQLIEQHVRFGKTFNSARAWTMGPDQQNAELVAATRHRADIIIERDFVEFGISSAEDDCGLNDQGSAETL